MSGKGKFGGFMQALESIESIDNTESPQPISEAQKTGSMHQPNRNDPYSQSILHQGRSRIKSLEAEIEKYKDLVDNGRLEQDIKITQIDRPPLVMRSEHYWSTPRFKEIKESIRRKGLHEPITVRPSPDKKGRYLLVKGDTRLTSHEHLREETGDDQWDTIRARIEVIDDRMSILKMVVENRDRADVSAYDQACFFTQVLNSICDGDRASAMELLDIDKATMSRSVTISKLPRNVMDTFVSLFEAGGRSLYELTNTIEEYKERIPMMLDAAEKLADSRPKPQVDKLIKFLQDQPKRPSPPPLEAVTTSDGKVLARIKYTKGTASLVIDEAKMPGFSDMLREKLESTYQEWLAQRNRDSP